MRKKSDANGRARPSASAIYDADMYDFARAPGHYWSATAGPVGTFQSEPLDTDTIVDVAIIGGGYAGLSAALRLAGKHHVDVCVLEAGASIGWGASGANGGFVAPGGVKLSIMEIAKRVGEDEARRYLASQNEAVDALRSFIQGNNNIACEMTGDGGVCVAHHPAAAGELRDEAEVLSRRFGDDAQFMTADQFRSEFHEGPETFGALRTRPGFAMHPYRLVQGMARAAAAAGARILTGTQIIDWQRQLGRHALTSANGIRVRASKVIVAANGYWPNHLGGATSHRVIPAISSIIVTQPYTDSELASRGLRATTPIYNSRNLLFYYRRLPDGRILFGSRGDVSGTPEAAVATVHNLEADLKRVLPGLSDARAEYAWRGLVALTARRSLALGIDPSDTSVVFAFGCHGSGTATISWAGRKAADLSVAACTEADLPAVFRGLPPRLPSSPHLIRWGLRAAYGYYALRDDWAC